MASGRMPVYIKRDRLMAGYYNCLPTWRCNDADRCKYGQYPKNIRSWDRLHRIQSCTTWQKGSHHLPTIAVTITHTTATWIDGSVSRLDITAELMVGMAETVGLAQRDCNMSSVPEELQLLRASLTRDARCEWGCGCCGLGKEGEGEERCSAKKILLLGNIHKRGNRAIWFCPVAGNGFQHSSVPSLFDVVVPLRLYWWQCRAVQVPLLTIYKFFVSIQVVLFHWLLLPHKVRLPRNYKQRTARIRVYASRWLVYIISHGMLRTLKVRVEISGMKAE